MGGNWAEFSICHVMLCGIAAKPSYAYNAMRMGYARMVPVGWSQFNAINSRFDIHNNKYDCVQTDGSLGVCVCYWCSLVAPGGLPAVSCARVMAT